MKNTFLIFLLFICSPSFSQNFNSKIVAEDPIIGTWINIDSNARSIPKVEISANGKLKVTEINVYGSCVPVYCNWGKQPLLKLNHTNYITNYNWSWSQVAVRVEFKNDMMIINTSHHFTDNSGRKEIINNDTLTKFTLIK